jgi:hypothetical protein
VYLLEGTEVRMAPRPQRENLGGEACRFYLEGEPGEEFSPGAEANVALVHD